MAEVKENIVKEAETEIETDIKNKRAAEKKMTPKERVIMIIGDIASVMSVIMYVSYIPQIMANLSGTPGVVWQPLAAFFNCCFWTVYGIWTKPRQWPIIIANVPGIFLALITVITCFIH